MPLDPLAIDLAIRRQSAEVSRRVRATLAEMAAVRQRHPDCGADLLPLGQAVVDLASDASDLLALYQTSLDGVPPFTHQS